MTSRWSRRRFLTGGATAAVAAVLAACRRGGSDRSATTSTTARPVSTLAPVDLGDPDGPAPFTLGVASGDPDHESVVLWTFVDHAGDEDASLIVEVALDEAFTAIVQRSSVVAAPERGHAIHHLATGLEPDTTYWYRFALDGHVTSPARTRTAPAPGELPTQLRVAHLSCQRYSSGYWTALADVAAQLPDLVVHCGDYVYESDGGDVRPVDVTAPSDLAGYRALWRRYKREPELQAAHAVAPWLMIWDDHEVENNGHRPELRAAAYRAWWEHTPTRVPEPDPGATALRIHRTIDWGGLTRFVLLDTRQYRDPQPCEGGLAADVGPRCDASATVTMLGAEQEAWLGEVATGHDAVWTSVVQSVVVHQWRFLPGNAVWNLDQWDGYPAARQRLLTTLAQAPGPVVLSGDVHSSWVARLTDDFDDPDAGPVGVEFVAPGVSSQLSSSIGAVVGLAADQPHVAWSETSHQGWVLHDITPDAWAATFRLVDATGADGVVRPAARWVTTEMSLSGP